jgi:hypothetical protein
VGHYFGLSVQLAGVEIVKQKEAGIGNKTKRKLEVSGGSSTQVVLHIHCVRSKGWEAGRVLQLLWAKHHLQ